jgi:hypothetical protein
MRKNEPRRRAHRRPAGGAPCPTMSGDVFAYHSVIVHQGFPIIFIGDPAGEMVSSGDKNSRVLTGDSRGVQEVFAGR